MKKLSIVLGLSALVYIYTKNNSKFDFQSEEALLKVQQEMRENYSKNFEEMSSIEQNKYINLNRERIIMIKHRLDEKIKRLKI